MTPRRGYLAAAADLGLAAHLPAVAPVIAE